MSLPERLVNESGQRDAIRASAASNQDTHGACLTRPITEELLVKSIPGRGGRLIHQAGPFPPAIGCITLESSRTKYWDSVFLLGLGIRFVFKLLFNNQRYASPFGLTSNVESMLGW